MAARSLWPRGMPTAACRDPGRAASCRRWTMRSWGTSRSSGGPQPAAAQAQDEHPYQALPGADDGLGGDHRVPGRDYVVVVETNRSAHPAVPGGAGNECLAPVTRLSTRRVRQAW